MNTIKTSDIKSYASIVEDIKNNWLYHNSEAERFKKLYDMATMPGPGTEISIKEKQDSFVLGTKTHPSKMNDKPYPNKVSKKETFEDVIICILNEKGRPMYSSELVNSYELKKAVKIERKNFSSKLAIVAKTKNSIINNEYKELPNNIRFWWGLKDWYRGDDFESPFKDKIMIEAEKIGGPELFNKKAI
ncbi:MAG TPA: hypothetical protein VIJ75_07355 [Hanamia sp.]